jgi:hypothetical protein
VPEIDLEQARKHWAFEPAADPPLPAVRVDDWATSPIDAFILAGLEAKGLSPAPPADKRTLIRRVTFDLIGLPPTTEEVAAFLADDSPQAFERLVDRLLDSPHYGERWGRHWLDVARYADSNGLDENLAHGNAWRYRDYVVAAFNNDKPYDEFVREQLAGDLLPSGGSDGENDARHRERLIATGFLSLGPKVLAEVDEIKMEMDIVDEQIDTVGKSLLGLTLGCARCHSHKFDPLLTEDYYALAGIFKSTRTMEHFKKIARWWENSLATDEQLDEQQRHEGKVAAAKGAIDKFLKQTDDKLRETKGAEFKLPEKPEARETLYDKKTKAELVRLRAELKTLEDVAPVIPTAMGVTDGDVNDVRVHIRGSHLNQGELVPRRFPFVLAGLDQPPLPSASSGRLEFANWLTSPGHPLTARVMVNRIWRWHFGTGIVATPDNFGRQGARPTHPELLDWLSRRFVEEGWSIKRLHRAILLSSTYRMSSRYDQAAAAVDPENRLLWRFPVQRLEAEEIRDALLAVSGKLDRTIGGTLLTHVGNREFIFNHTSQDGTTYDTNRRSLYLPVVRNHVYDVLELFDFPDPAVQSGDRSSTVVAPQALLMLNSNLVMNAANDVAQRLLADDGLRTADNAKRVDRLYELCLSRPPSEAETSRALAFVKRFTTSAKEATPQETRLKAWQALCHVVLSSNEFVYLR